jgi:hypothetical protein
MCARQGAPAWRCKSSTHPTGGSVSQTARVSTVRWNLKEAGGKALARRTGTASEAAMLDERAVILKVQYLYGRHGSICGGHKREGRSALPGEVCISVPEMGLSAPRDAEKEMQKSAEAIVGASAAPKG